MTEEQRALMLQGIVHDADRMDTILRCSWTRPGSSPARLELFPEQVDVGQLVADIDASQARDPDHPGSDMAGWRGVRLRRRGAAQATLLAFVEGGGLVGSEGPISVDAVVRDGTLDLERGATGTELVAADAETLFLPRKPGKGAGSKIGLFVSRGVAQVQGGRSWARRSRTGRLVFHLELPAARTTGTLTPALAVGGRGR